MPRQCRAIQGLTTLTPERIAELMTPGPQYAASTILKHQWVLLMYDGWCEGIDTVGFPLEKNIVAGFIKYLG